LPLHLEFSYPVPAMGESPEAEHYIERAASQYLLMEEFPEAREYIKRAASQ
jgi:hypothetical protein